MEILRNVVVRLSTMVEHSDWAENEMVSSKWAKGSRIIGTIHKDTLYGQM